jgi:methylase of polypeptide subunit release factors
MYESTGHLTKEFKYGLEQLGMLDAKEAKSNGLVFTGTKPQNNYEYLALEKAAAYNAHAVYFKQFENRNTSIPQVYIYDFTTGANEPNMEEICQLHLKLWNSGQVPMFFVFTKSEIKIFNCLKSPKYDIKTGKITSSPMETINLAAHIDEYLEKAKLKEFSARKLDNGSFWDTSKYRKKFQQKDSSYEKLLNYLKYVRKNFYKKCTASMKDIPGTSAEKESTAKSIVDKLLVMSILLKYLEERVDQDGNKVFPYDFFSDFAVGATCFIDVLKKGSCLALFDYLSNHFNGEIFKWEDKKERELLAKIDLGESALFFEARSETGGQRTLWSLYSFNDLPIELISNIYEEFLVEGDKKGIVYTPPYLVHFLIDESMPLESPSDDFKVLDPACGSGVFLVAAYQRILDWWRIRNNWEKPGLGTLKKLLKDSIYGVDIEPQAVRLAIFSLSLVLLDSLSPKEIWEKLKFEDLNQSGNLFEADFFHLIHEGQIKSKFNLVIGNPPFVEKLTTHKAVDIEEKQQQVRPPVPGNQLSLLFLEQALEVCKTGGHSCLILPSGPLLYNIGSHDFRTYLFQKYNVKQILDFTSLSDILFASAKVATAAIFVKKEEPESTTILHATFRRTKVSKDKLYLQLDHYDFHRVAYKHALKSPLIWKANLLGGGRLFSIISRLAEMDTFGNYLERKKRENGWVVAEGYTVAANEDEIQQLKKYHARQDSLEHKERDEFNRLKKKYKKAAYLTGKDAIPPEALTENGLIESQIYTLEEEYFIRNREKNKKIFKGPHLLIRELVGKNSIPVVFTNKYLSFTHQIIGIHAPVDDIDKLKEIEKRIKNNRVFLFHLACFSGRCMVSKATSILKSDIDNLPYPENKDEFEFSGLEHLLMNDVLDYILEFRRKGEASSVMEPVSQDQLARFGETYCKQLNTIYKKFKPYPHIETDNFICFPVYFGNEPNLEITDPDQFEKSLNQLVHKKIGRNLEISRVLRIYDKNIIYMVKPKQIRYWLCSVAIRDADETFEDLVKQGY